MKHLQKANLRYPGLWRGCVGAWAPLLGPSGATLRDQSPSGNHGTLTNMDAATDWVVSGGKYALNFDGTNDRIALKSNKEYFTNRASVSLWANVTVASNFPLLFSCGDTVIGDGDNGFELRLNGTTGIPQFMVDESTGRPSATGTTSIVNTGWKHLCGTYDGTTITIYVDGVSVGTNTGSGNITMHPTSAAIGSRPGATLPVTARIDDVRVYTIGLVATDVRLLATRRGIAYETIQRRSYKSAAAPAGNRRRRIICGQG